LAFLVLALLLGMLGLGMPVVFSIMAASFVYFFLTPVPDGVFIQRMISGLDAFPLLAVPFFVLTGTAMSRGGIARRLLGLADALVGHMRGGLGQVNVVNSVFIGGMSGSGNADAAIDSKTIVPVMVRFGYGTGFASAVTAASGVIAPIIPPGIGLVIYGLLAEVSIGRLFIGGIIPALLMAGVLMMVVNRVSYGRDYGRLRERRLPLREVLVHFKDAIWALMMPVLLIIGLRAGVFTPTELGAVAALYALLVGTVIYREIPLRELPDVFVEAVLSTAIVMLILGAASSLTFVFTWERVPHQLVEGLLGFSQNPYWVLLLLNVVMLAMGTVLEGTALLVILTPMLVPVIRQLGIDPVHFGVVMIINLTIGAITPPVGTILYTVCSITGCKVGEFTREIVPFFLALVAVLLLLSFVPQVVLFLPNLIMGT
jgi:tripartite ATP-independent transporter DctM subunit